MVAGGGASACFPVNGHSQTAVVVAALAGAPAERCGDGGAFGIFLV